MFYIDSTLHLLQSLKCVGLHSLRKFNYVVCNRHPETKKNVVLAEPTFRSKIKTKNMLGRSVSQDAPTSEN